MLTKFAHKEIKFQFTHPGRGATQANGKEGSKVSRFNSRTPGGVRRLVGKYPKYFKFVSIHAPREGCDCTLKC